MSDTHGAPLEAVQAFLSEMAETMGVELGDAPTVKGTLPLLVQAARNNRELLARWQGQKPVDMILFCPHCNTQHIDAPDPVETDARKAIGPDTGATIQHFKLPWYNPPHRTHLCRLDQGGCGWMWRPSDVATNGVLHLASKHPREMGKPQWEMMAAKRYQETHINPPYIRLSRVYKCGCTANGPGTIPPYCPQHGTPP